MSDIKLKAANGGGSISLKGPSTAGSDTDFLDTSGNLKVTGNTTVDGKILIGTTTTLGSNADDLNIKTTGNTGISIQSGTSSAGNIYFADGTSGTALYRGYVTYNHSGDSLSLGTANTTALSIDSNGNIEADVGNIVIGTSGKGIDFSATSDGNGTDTSELLDDYEEGTFTPTSHGWSAGGTTTYTSQKGTYIKVGRMVTVMGVVGWSAISGASGVHAIGGLPYATNGSFDWEGTNFIHTINMGDGKVSGKIGDGYSSSFLLYVSNAGSEGYVSADTNGGECTFTVTYIAT